MCVPVIPMNPQGDKVLFSLCLISVVNNGGNGGHVWGIELGFAHDLKKNAMLLCVTPILLITPPLAACELIKKHREGEKASPLRCHGNAFPKGNQTQSLSLSLCLVL